MLKFFEENNSLAWFTTVVIAIGIFIISSIPGSGGYGGENYFAIIYHFSSFFFLGAFLMISTVKGKNKKMFPIAIIIAIFYAILDEFHQYFVPGRFASAGDVITDSLGILSAFSIYFLILKLRR